MEEFGGFAFEGVADELENPSEYEKGSCVRPQAVEENAGHEDRYRDQDRGNAQGVAGSVDGMLVTGRVLRDPLFVGAVA